MRESDVEIVYVVYYCEVVCLFVKYKGVSGFLNLNLKLLYE